MTATISSAIRTVFGFFACSAHSFSNRACSVFSPPKKVPETHQESGPQSLKVHCAPSRFRALFLIQKTEPFLGPHWCYLLVALLAVCVESDNVCLQGICVKCSEFQWPVHCFSIRECRLARECICKQCNSVWTNLCMCPQVCVGMTLGWSWRYVGTFGHRIRAVLGPCWGIGRQRQQRRQRQQWQRRR